MEWFRSHYLRTPSEIEHWTASPLRAPDLGLLPEAMIVTGGYDPLCDEGAEYATRLQQNGVVVNHLHLPGQMHGFMTLGLDASQKILEEISKKLANVWAN